MCNKEISSNQAKPHVGSVLNIISKHIEKKGFDSLGVELLDLFIWLA